MKIINFKKRKINICRTIMKILLIRVAILVMMVSSIAFSTFLGVVCFVAGCKWLWTLSALLHFVALELL